MVGSTASKVVGQVAGGGIVDGVIAGVGSTLSNGEAVKNGVVRPEALD